MRARLDQAAGIGRAAKACTDAGNVSEEIEIALDVEQLILRGEHLLERSKFNASRQQELIDLPPPALPASAFGLRDMAA